MSTIDLPLDTSVGYPMSIPTKVLARERFMLGEPFRSYQPGEAVNLSIIRLMREMLMLEVGSDIIKNTLDNFYYAELSMILEKREWFIERFSRMGPQYPRRYKNHYWVSLSIAEATMLLDYIEATRNPLPS